MSRKTLGRLTDYFHSDDDIYFWLRHKFQLKQILGLLILSTKYGNVRDVKIPGGGNMSTISK